MNKVQSYMLGSGQTGHSSLQEERYSFFTQAN